MIRRLTVLLAAVLLLSSTVAARADTTALTIRTTELASFTPFPQLVRFGKLEWRGGLALASDDPRFGGLSGLALAADGSALLAISDRGLWFRTDLRYDGTRLAGVADPRMAPILDANGKPNKGKARSDAEALAAWEPNAIDGKIIVGFESRARAGLFDLKSKGFAAPFNDLNLPADVANGPFNAELEAIGRFHAGPLAGSLIALSESNKDENGDLRAWIWGGKRRFSFAIKQHEDFALTDLAILSNGDVLTLERSFGASRLPGVAIRRIRAADIVAGGAVAPVLIFSGRAPTHAVDNMEGLAVSRNALGETILTLLSDDNYNRPAQRTLLLQFALLP